MTGSRNITVHDRLECGEASVHSALVPEETTDADAASGRQIYKTFRESRCRNVAGLLTVVMCSLVACYVGGAFSSPGRVDSRTQANDALVSVEEVNASNGMPLEEVKTSNGTAEKPDLTSAQAKVMKLKKQLEKAQAKVMDLSQTTPVEADTTNAAPTTAAATTAEKKAITAEQKDAQQDATTAEQKTTTTEQKATTVTEKTTTTEEKKETIPPDPSFGWPTDVYWPRLFCWSVMNKDNVQEVATMKMQVKMHIGIASCERFAVLSGIKMYLGEGHKWDNGTAVKVHSWENPAKPVPMGNLGAGDETNSFKNTDIFINAWNILISSKIMQGDVDWVIKADPDAVFFPERLRKHVKPFSWGQQTKTPLYFKNCFYKGPKLYGALEVFNQAAMLKLSSHMSWCTSLPWGGWGEDEFIDKCMERLSAKALQDYKLVGDHRCMSAECEATDRASFHDYKTPELYQNCWNRSKNSEKWVKQMAEGNFFCCTSPGNPGDPCNTCNPGASTKAGQGWCGSSKNQCKGCGTGATWCKFDKKKKRNMVAA